jgi:hypothetical protein
MGGFGLIGAVNKVSTPEWQAWNDAVAACFKAKMGET